MDILSIITVKAALNMLYISLCLSIYSCYECCWPFNFAYGTFSCIEALNLGVVRYSVFVFIDFTAGVFQLENVFRVEVLGTAWYIDKQNKQKSPHFWNLRKLSLSQGQKCVFFQ